MPIYALGDRVPAISPNAFVHPDAVIIGDVTVEDEASIWPNAVLRGDYGTIVVGARTSVQDGTVVHATSELPTLIGNSCVIGHIVHLEGCQIQDHSLVGSGSIVLHRAVVESHSLVGANAVVTSDTTVPTGAMALGIPAKIFTDRVSPGEFDIAVDMYVANARRYLVDLRRIG